MVVDLIFIALVSLLIVIWLKERALYVIFAWAYFQNFVLAWAYTSGLASKNICLALLIAKEFLLLWLFLHYMPRLSPYLRTEWLVPVRILIFFTAWCVLRYAFAVILQGDSLFGNLRDLRLVCFPIEILTVGLGVTYANPMFAKRFIRHMVSVVAVVAMVGILLDVLPALSFWRSHVNFASYNIEVKDQSLGADLAPSDVLADEEGITGNGLGRTAFSFLAFRAFGTIGDAVGFGHLVAFPILLLAFWLRGNWKKLLMLGATAMALFLSFTRSAWIFVIIGFVYILLRNKRYRLLCALAIPMGIALFIWAPLAQWYSASLARLSWNSPDDPHVQGIVWFYKHGLWQASNLLGQGFGPHLPEGGYGRLLIRYGWPAVMGFVWFCIVLYQELRRAPICQKPLSLIAQAVPLGLIVIMNFSAYPLSFIPYLLVWFVVGACLAVSSVNCLNSANGKGRAVASFAGEQL